MNKKSKLSIVVFVVCLFLIKSTYSQSQSTLNFTTSHIVYDMTADSNNLWIATQGGLSRVILSTGQRIVYTAANTPFRNNDMRSTLIDRYGNVWCGGIGLYKFDGVHWDTYYSLSNGDLAIGVVQIKEDKHGRIIFLNDHGSVVIHSSSGDSSIFPTQVPFVDPQWGTPPWFQSFDVDSTGALWFATGMV